MTDQERGLDQKGNFKNQSPKGTNYLLAIAINDYLHCTKLNNAVRDAEALIELLTIRYHFDPEHVTFIKDGDATKKNIETAFDDLIEFVGPQDNLIVYFSGHGRYNERRGGFWIPIDASNGDKAWTDYLSNSLINDYLGKIKSFHTFLIADSCFSGSLFTDNREVKSSNDRRDTEPSRWGLTSGKKEPVRDGKPGTHSPFAAALLGVLSKTEKPLGVVKICDEVLELVAANELQTPMFSPLKVSGHLGGQMVLYPKGYKLVTNDLDIPKPDSTILRNNKFSWVNIGLAVLGLVLLLITPYLIPDHNKELKGQNLIDLFDMEYVEGDTFLMGSNDGREDERPEHSVKLSDFYIGKTEVTKRQWLEVMGSLPKGVDQNMPDDYPIVKLNWNDVQKFIKKLNQKTDTTYRLPTEAEWEFVAKGGKHKSPYEYAGGNDLDKVAWYFKNSGNKLHPVRENGHANAVGIFDMSGNVWEWCSDYYAKYPDTLEVNPLGPPKGKYRVVRGGSWGSEKSQSLRCAARGKKRPDFNGNDTGFRLVMPVGAN